MDQPTCVGVVDDHPSIVAAISDAITATDDLVLAGAGRTLADAIDLVPLVDVLVCDVQLEGHAEGLQVVDVARSASHPPAVLLFSGFGHGSVIRAALERGAAGYLDKGVETDAIIDAIRTVAAGGTVFRAADLQASLASPRRPSERELQVIAAVVAGSTNAEVAARLRLSEKTVETHLHRLFDRYGLLSRTELAVLAINEGWTPRP
jgi:DNA-binding NarL/FixJ family response regulator